MSRQLLREFEGAAMIDKRLRDRRVVPPGFRLEFGVAIPGNMKVSFQAARSIG